MEEAVVAVTLPNRLYEAMRSLDALPDDDWQPHDHDAFEAARAVLRDFLRREDRHRERAPKKAIQSRPKPKQDPPELREAKKAVRARSRGVCEAATPFCTGSAQHFHHRKPRSAGGSHSEVNGLDVCLTCHRYLHDHPASSYERGLLLHSWENEGREVTG